MSAFDEPSMLVIENLPSDSAVVIRGRSTVPPMAYAGPLSFLEEVRLQAAGKLAVGC
jgi:hypothetical protein